MIVFEVHHSTAQCRCGGCFGGSNCPQGFPAHDHSYWCIHFTDFPPLGRHVTYTGLLSYDERNERDRMVFDDLVEAERNLRRAYTARFE